MKYKFLCIIFALCLFGNRTIHPLNFSAISSGLKKGVEIAGHIATGVDMAIGIAGVGVTLWGSEGDKDRFSKAANITNIITSLARGDINGAQSAAEGIRGKKAESPIYEPLTEDALADADIVPVEPGPTRRALGDKTKFSNDQLATLRAQRKDVTVNDLKIAQFSEAKNQLVFVAKDLPQAANQSKIYKLLNGIDILFTTQDVANNTANIVIKRLVGNTGIEIGTIKCSLDELSKGLFVGTTNGELSIFFKDGNLIKKTILIQNMNQ